MLARLNLFTGKKTQLAPVKTEYNLDELYEKYKNWIRLNEEIGNNYEEILKLKGSIKYYETNANQINNKYSETYRDAMINFLRRKLDPLNKKYEVDVKEENELDELLKTLPEETKKNLAEKIVNEQELEIERGLDFYRIGATDNTGKGGSKRKRNKRRKSRKKIVKKSRSIKKH